MDNENPTPETETPETEGNVETTEAPETTEVSAEQPQTVVQQEFGDKAVMDINIKLSVTLGKSMLRVHQMLKLGRGAVLELDQKMDEPVEVYANNILIAHGDVIVTDDDKLGITIKDMIKAQ